MLPNALVAQVLSVAAVRRIVAKAFAVDLIKLYHKTNVFAIISRNLL